MITTGVVYRVSGVTLAGMLCSLESKFSSIALFPMVGEPLRDLCKHTEHGNPWVYLNLYGSQGEKVSHVWHDFSVLRVTLAPVDAEITRRSVQTYKPSYLTLLSVDRGLLGLYFIGETLDGQPDYDNPTFVAPIRYDSENAEPCDITHWNATVKKYTPFPDQLDYNRQIPIA